MPYGRSPNTGPVREHTVRIGSDGVCELIAVVVTPSKDEAVEVALAEGRLLGWKSPRALRARTNADSYTVTVTNS